ncbi:MAG TPA: PHP domain-containing protein [Candidatus Saccharimonadales bacterium]
MIKLDLHTHSTASNDGGVRDFQYIEAIETKIIDIVAITDHNRIDFAIKMHEKYPKNIIIGEEIMTKSGEIIGLFLTKEVPQGMSLDQTITSIHDQKGLCYVPHPLEKLRKGLGWNQLDKIKDKIDILEIGNGRALYKRNYKRLVNWAVTNKINTASSSDAHGKKGLGRSYTGLTSMPSDPDSLIKSLSSGVSVITYPSFIELLYPKYNRIRK